MIQRQTPLDVYITVDTETWCGGWDNIDRKFPPAFNNYIYGRTPVGDYGLPYQLALLKEHDLKAVFFVEPLFSMRFGKTYLEEIVGLILEAGQSVELHLHPEWTDESKQIIFPHITGKREHLKFFTYEEQKHLILLGLELLKDAGCNTISAFRAGSFGANDDTLRAASACGLIYDSSYDACIPECEISTSSDIQQPVQLENIIEVPMTTFIDGIGKRRHAQLTACSFTELKMSLNEAYKNHWQSYVLLSHSFELVNLAQRIPDKLVVRRFENLCAYLNNNRDKFRTCFFNDHPELNHSDMETVIKVSYLPTLKRYYEQLLRKLI